MQSRRSFLQNIAFVSFGAGALAKTAFAAAPESLSSTDPTAVALGYVADTAKADSAKYPQHKPDQKCSGCALYQGKAGEAAGPCAAFGGKLVAAGGWCMAYAKKP